MADFSLPDRHRDAVVSLLRMPPDEADALTARLQECGTKSPDLIAVLDDAVGGSGAMVLRTLVNFAVLPKRYGVSAEAIESSVKESFDVPDSPFPFAEIISLKPFQQLAKALDLRNAYANILLTSRIVTDIRPVFDGDDEDEEVGDIEAAMVNHTLQFKYRGSGEEREIHVAVDKGDLRRLQKQITRALNKEGAGEDFMNKAQAVALEPLEGDQ